MSRRDGPASFNLRGTGLSSVSLATAAGAALLLFAPAAVFDSVRLMAAISLVVTAASLLAMHRALGRNFYHPTLVFGTLLALFHFGAIWAWAARGRDFVAGVSPESNEWLVSPHLPTAVRLSCVFLLVFAWVTCALAVLPAAPKDRPLRLAKGEVIASTGLFFAIVGASSFAVFAIRLGGLALASGGYIDFLEGAQSSFIGYSLWMLSLGCCFSQLGSTRQRRLGLAIFTAFALFSFPVGLRGSVIFPGLALLVVRTMIGLRPRRWLIPIVGLVLAVLSQVVRVTRVGGDTRGFDILAAPANLVAEMGYTLRPVVEVLDWRANGVAPTGLTSFLAVPARFVESLRGTSTPDPDLRLFNVRINTWVGPIGGSPVAEGLLAGGLVGSVALAAVVAALLSRRVASQRDTLSIAEACCVVVPLFPTVRNAFAPVLPQMLLGLGLLALIGAPAWARRRDAAPSLRVPFAESHGAVVHHESRNG